jgi:hypothetical protein
LRRTSRSGLLLRKQQPQRPGCDEIIELASRAAGKAGAWIA